MKKTRGTIPGTDDLSRLSDEELITLRLSTEREMRRRRLHFSVGEIGERLVIAHFEGTAGLPKLLLAPTGTKNVDALSRDGDRYSIKTVLDAKKTGTIYPDPGDKDKQLFEHLLVARLNDSYALQSIHQFPWKTFCQLRSWDSRMSAWYLAICQRTLSGGRTVYQAPLTR
jgi:hypothetical protein